MLRIYAVLEEDGIKAYLQSRNLLDRYKIAKDKLIISTRMRSLDFKIREPKQERIFSFRITEKWRAYGYHKENVFVVSHISDHQ